MGNLPQFLLTISLLTSLSAAGEISDHLNLPSTATFPAATAERFIRALNLLPKDPSPEHLTTADVLPGSTVEKPLLLPGLSSEGSVEDLGHHAGYYRLSHSYDARLFYFFFESRQNKSDPVVIWLTGGPGCSSELAVFFENGPYNIADNMSLVWNEFGWDKIELASSMNDGLRAMELSIHSPLINERINSPSPPLSRIAWSRLEEAEWRCWLFGDARKVSSCCSVSPLAAAAVRLNAARRDSGEKTKLQPSAAAGSPFKTANCRQESIWARPLEF